MRNPDAGLDDRPQTWLAVVLALGWPGLVVAGVVGLTRLWRRRPRP